MFKSNLYIYTLLGLSSGFVFQDGMIFDQPETVGYIDAEVIPGTSTGCAASRVFPDVLYVHNDNDHTPIIFAINATTAQLVAILHVPVADHNGWTDMAVGRCSPQTTETCIYILVDVLDDSGARTIYKLAEPASLTDTLYEPQALKLQWSEKTSSVLMIDANATLYIISNVKDGHGMIVTIDADSWQNTEPLVLQSSYYFGMGSENAGPIGGDIAPDGKEILVRHSEAAFYYYSPDPSDIPVTMTKIGEQIPLAEEKLGEAICWAADAWAYYTLGGGLHQPLYRYNKIYAFIPP